MSLITPDELRQHVETDLDDDALQRIIDSQESIIISRRGAHGTQTQVFSPNLSKFLYLYRTASTITSITEYNGDETTTLEADDYDLLATGRRIDRLATGTNPATYWAPKTVVVYVPDGQEDRRIQALINLCKIEIEFTGLSSERIGDHSETQGDIADAKDSVIADLDDGGMMGM